MINEQEEKYGGFSKSDTKILMELEKLGVSKDQINVLINHKTISNKGIIDISRETGFPESELLAQAIALSFDKDYIDPLKASLVNKWSFQRKDENENKEFFQCLIDFSERTRVPYSYDKDINELIILVSDSNQAASALTACFNIKKFDNKMTIKVNIASQETVENIFLKIFTETEKEALELVKKINEGQGRIDDVINHIIKHACFSGVSDIHFKPLADSGMINFRKDGNVTEFCAVKKEVFEKIVNKIKTEGKQNSVIQETAEASYEAPPEMAEVSERYTFRVQISNTIRGEGVVFRILDSRNNIASLESIGFDPVVENELKHITRRSSGLLLITGPTGSGKTTTLYSLLKKIDPVKKEIQTVENPVEYHFGSWQQHEIGRKQEPNRTEGDKWKAYFKGLLRNDIDVGLLGEVRDSPTAEAALELANTGHLVFTTLHTNSASRAITRMIQMNIDMGIFFDIGMGIFAQRLVGKLCNHCKELCDKDSHEMDEFSYELFNTLKNSLELFDTNNREDLKFLEMWAKKLKTDVNNLKNIDIDYIKENIPLYKEKGCSYCSDSGFNGRKIVYELVKIDNKLRAKVDKGFKSSGQLLSDYPLIKKMWGIGLLRIIEGETTLNELRDRVDKEE